MVLFVDSVMRRRNGLALKALFVFLVSASETVGASASSQKKNALRAFQRAMNQPEQDRLRKTRLNQKLLDKAVFRMPQQAQQQAQQQGGQQQQQELDERSLRRLDADDAYFGYAFDVSSYSLKYTQCSAVSTWNDDLADDADSPNVLTTKRFVVFRLCPSAKCSASNAYGCDYNYGEYLIDMADYLEAMQQFTEERFEAYCDYCEQCMALEAQDDAARRRLADDAVDDAYNGGGDDAADDGNGDDDAAADDAAADDAVDDAAKNDDAANDDGHACAYYDECVNYADTCEAADDDGAVVYENFFECQLYENQNGVQMYIGPHCKSDGHTIVIGLYYDEYCSRYAGDNVNLNQFTKMNFDDDGLADYTKDDCYSCLESELPYNQVDDDVQDADAISEICEDLYFQSAKCNKALGSSYYSQNELNAENMVCYFISNIVSNKYDEYGEIYLSNFDYREYIEIFKEQVSPAQGIGIAVLASLSLLLLVYSCVLHGQLQRVKADGGNPDFQARKGLYYGDISRNNSGIVIGRSRSGGDFPGMD